MKNRSLILTLLIAVAAMAFTIPTKKADADGGGIKFSDMRLVAALGQAKKTGKLIFIDVHTSWCGPCKQMAKTTFKSEKVGNVFNSKFINLKIDAEQDPDGAEVSNAYSVAAYPTLLFIDGDGKLVKKLIGMQSEDRLLEEVKKLSKK